MAIFIYSSRNINFKDCDVFFTKQVGVVIDLVTNVHFDSVNVFDVH
jgi:hypothetical protein